MKLQSIIWLICSCLHLAADLGTWELGSTKIIGPPSRPPVDRLTDQPTGCLTDLPHPLAVSGVQFVPRLGSGFVRYFMFDSCADLIFWFQWFYGLTGSYFRRSGGTGPPPAKQQNSYMRFPTEGVQQSRHWDEKIKEGRGNPGNPLMAPASNLTNEAAVTLAASAPRKLQEWEM